LIKRRKLRKMKKFKFISFILCLVVLLLSVTAMTALSETAVEELVIEPNVGLKVCFTPSPDTRAIKHKIYAKNIGTFEEQSFVFESTKLFSEDFESYAVGTNPSNWVNTGGNNSMTENKSLFKIYDVDGDKVLGTASTVNNIHSHSLRAYLDKEKIVEYSGRMRKNHVDGGIGITFYSHYPFKDNYYRVRCNEWTKNLHIAPHPHGIAKVSGTTTSSVTLEVGKWYRFRIQIIDNAGKTEILSKAWPDDRNSEPTVWQMNAYDGSAQRFVSGTFGLWSGGSGVKYWDDLKVSRVVDPGDSCVVGTNAYVFEKGYFKPGNTYDLSATALDMYDNESVHSNTFRVITLESVSPGGGSGGGSGGSDGGSPQLMTPILPPGPIEQAY
jgi:hypothetical protein